MVMEGRDRGVLLDPGQNPPQLPIVGPQDGSRWRLSREESDPLTLALRVLPTPATDGGVRLHPRRRPSRHVSFHFFTPSEGGGVSGGPSPFVTSFVVAPESKEGVTVPGRPSAGLSSHLDAPRRDRVPAVDRSAALQDVHSREGAQGFRGGLGSRGG